MPTESSEGWTPASGRLADWIKSKLVQVLIKACVNGISGAACDCGLSRLI
jgi:hypothetical protein